MHRLVQDVVRLALTPDEQRTWASRAVCAVAYMQPAADTFHFGTFLRVLPQSMVAVELIERWQMQTLDAAGLMERLGAFYQQAGDYVDSRRLLMRALRFRKRLQHHDHPDIAETRTYLAELALSLGEFAQAEALARAALQQRQAQLPASDARVAHATRLASP